MFFGRTISIFSFVFLSFVLGMSFANPAWAAGRGEKMSFEGTAKEEASKTPKKKQKTKSKNNTSLQASEKTLPLTKSKLMINLPQIKEFDDVVEISPSPWGQLQLCLDDLIKATLADSSYENRTFRFQVTREDWESYCLWEDALMEELRYPFSCGSANKGAEGERVKGIYSIYHKELTLRNYTKKEGSARNINEYKFFGGTLDERLLKKRTFYNLMARIGFTEEDFTDGSTGLQGRIAVKPIELKSKTLAGCKKELEEIIGPTLEKSPEIYITFVFNLPSGAEYTFNDFSKFEEGIITSHFRKFINLATIYENAEHRLYLCFKNDRRQMLDLHGFEKDGKYNGITKAGALELVRNYIYEKYTNFQSKCTILTGKGNHQNSNGTTGVLHSAFQEWMLDESINPLVKEFIPIESNGGFKVFLKTPTVCDLTKLKEGQDPCDFFCKAIKKAIKTDDMRLSVRFDSIGFDYTLLHFLILKDSELFQEISPLSMKFFPGELRLYFKNSEDSDQIDTSANSKEEEKKVSQVKPNSQKEPIKPAPSKKAPVNHGNGGASTKKSSTTKKVLLHKVQPSVAEQVQAPKAKKNANHQKVVEILNEAEDFFQKGSRKEALAKLHDALTKLDPEDSLYPYVKAKMIKEEKELNKPAPAKNQSSKTSKKKNPSAVKKAPAKPKG